MVRQKKHQEGGPLVFSLSAPWQKRRRGQGYSFAEVSREIARRAKGEYGLSPELCQEVLFAAKREVEKRFKLAALLSDFLRAERTTKIELALLLSTGAEDTIDAMLDPFPLFSGESIRTNELIGDVYPGALFSLKNRKTSV